MIDPVSMAMRERDRQCQIALAQRIQLQRQEDNATTFTGFWRSLDPVTGLHRVELKDGGFVWCTSITGTGFTNGNVVTLSRPKGAVYGRIRIRR